MRKFMLISGDGSGFRNRNTPAAREGSRSHPTRNWRRCFKWPGDGAPRPADTKPVDDKPADAKPADAKLLPSGLAVAEAPNMAIAPPGRPHQQVVPIIACNGHVRDGRRRPKTGPPKPPA